MTSKLIPFTITVLALVAATASHARGNDIEFDSAPAAVMSQTSRMQVRDAAIAARAFTQINGNLYGSVTQHNNDAPAISREQVRQQTQDYVRSHKRDMDEVA